MATTAEAQEFIRCFRTVHVDMYCDHEDCHGTHVDRIDWEIALRRCEELGTPEVMAALDEDERNLLLWVAYVAYVREKFTGDPSLPRPPYRREPRVIIPPEVEEAGLTREALGSTCSVCDDSECRICTVPEGSNRMQQVVLRERRVLRRLDALNKGRSMTEFFNELQRRREESDGSIVQ